MLQCLGCLQSCVDLMMLVGIEHLLVTLFRSWTEEKRRKQHCRHTKSDRMRSAVFLSNLHTELIFSLPRLWNSPKQAEEEEIWGKRKEGVSRVEWDRVALQRTLRGSWWLHQIRETMKMHSDLPPPHHQSKHTHTALFLLSITQALCILSKHCFRSQTQSERPGITLSYAICVKNSTRNKEQLLLLCCTPVDPCKVAMKISCPVCREMKRW